MDQHDDEFDNEFQLVIKKFEEMLNHKNTTYFFDSDTYNDLINYYVIQNNPQIAYKAVIFASEQFPEMTMFLVRKSQLLSFLNKDKEALALLKKIEGLEGETPEYWIIYGSIYSKLGKHTKAVESYKKALNFESCPPEAYLFMAFEFEAHNDYLNAIEYLEIGVKKMPNNAMALETLVNYYQMEGILERGIAFLDELFLMNPYSEMLWLGYGLLYEQSGNLKKSMEAYDYLEAINPELTIAHYNKAVLLEELGRFKEAIELYKKVIESEPENALTLLSIAECYEELAQYPEAIDAYLKTIKINPEFATAWVGLAFILFETKEFDEGLKCAEQAIELDSEDAEAWHIYGKFQNAMGLPQIAIQSLQKSIELDPNNEMAWEVYINILVENESQEEVLATLQVALKLNTESAQLNYYASYLYLHYEMNRKAYSLFKKAYKQDPKLAKKFAKKYPSVLKNKIINDLIHPPKH